MAVIDLGQGGQLDSLKVTPSFPGGIASATLLIPDRLFPDIKGSLRHSSGSNPDARTIGQTAMGATATGVVRGSGFAVGFKQLANFKFHSAFYIGIKDTDGCIEETSTGLNFRSFLDCSADENLQSPWAPFYLPQTVVGNGKDFSVDMPDQPGGRLRLQRRNSKRDRLNFLVAYRTKCEFLTYFVVARPDGTHLPIKGFSWQYTHDIDVAWSKGNPTVQSNVGGARLEAVIDNLKAGDSRFDLLANKGLTTADTMVTQFNRAMFAAQRREASADYSITEFDNYTENITPEMQRRVPIE
jgi:hypothetical protein